MGVGYHYLTFAQSHLLLRRAEPSQALNRHYLDPPIWRKKDCG
jgi:hypothetical protein